MKKTFTFFALFFLTLALTSSYTTKDSSGKAGYTGAPGEQTCAGGGCHSGGSSTAKNITITASPSFSLDQYFPDTVYTVTVTVNASGFTKFGFDCEILNINNLSIGTMQNAGAGVKFLTAGNARKNVTHTTPKTGTGSASFTFKWVAPGAGASDATFYVCGNAVNGNGSTNGDLPIPHSYVVSEGTAPTPTTNVSIKENPNSALANIAIFPNPSHGLTTISYYLKTTKTICVELTDINGKRVKELSNESQAIGNHSEMLNLQDVSSGVYFIKISSDGMKVSQKLITVN